MINQFSLVWFKWIVVLKWFGFKAKKPIWARTKTYKPKRVGESQRCRSVFRTLREKIKIIYPI